MTKTIDAHLARLTPQKRQALERLRKLIRRAAPTAQECISYGIPAFRWHGKFLVGFGATAKHCSFYPGAVIATLGADLTGYDLSKGTIRFQPEKPLPSALVRKIVRLRMARLAPANKS